MGGEEAGEDYSVDACIVEVSGRARIMKGYSLVLHSLDGKPSKFSPSCRGTA